MDFTNSLFEVYNHLGIILFVIALGIFNFSLAIWETNKWNREITPKLRYTGKDLINESKKVYLFLGGMVLVITMLYLLGFSISPISTVASWVVGFIMYLFEFTLDQWEIFLRWAF